MSETKVDAAANPPVDPPGPPVVTPPNPNSDRFLIDARPTVVILGPVASSAFDDPSHCKPDSDAHFAATDEDAVKESLEARKRREQEPLV